MFTLAFKLRLKLRLIKEVLTFGFNSIYDKMYIDPVTGLLNRKAFEQASYTQVAIVDMDSLKYLNDNLGHETGDKALRMLATFLLSVFGENNVFRLGGDEFAVISQLPLTDLSFVNLANDACEHNGTYSWGVGVTISEADEDLNLHKAVREEDGSRAPRGERPPWLYSPGGNIIEFSKYFNQLN